MTGKFEYRKQIREFSEQDCLEALKNAGLAPWKREMLNEQRNYAKNLGEFNETNNREEKDQKMLELASDANALAADANAIANGAKTFSKGSTIIAVAAVLVSLIATWDKITALFA